jgi:NAD(P)-dependent dehydrogenase (short-subunit alcohol dehydrogenase family)
MPDFSGKVVLITGGTSGIGRHAAGAFARAGAKVLFTGRRANLGQEVAAEIKAGGGEATYFRADVTKEDDVRASIDAALAAYGRLDCAVNNAGTAGTMPVVTHEQTVEHFRQVIDTNVLGVLLSMKYEVPAMLKTGGGVIVNIASIAGSVALPGAGVYVTSKHAVLGLTKTAAVEYIKQGVRICSVAPGGVDTPMWPVFAGPNAPENTFRVQAETVLHPLGRIGRTSEITAAILYLCSPDAAFAVGTNLIVDGGWTLQ